LRKALAQLELLAANGLAEPGAAERARGLLAASTEFDATVAEADLVVESAPEDMAFKKDLFAHMDRIAKPGAPLCSNTSGLSITEIATACARPGRVLTTHFWNPPHLMPLVEIVRGARTDPAVADAVKALLVSCGKTVVVVKRDTPGQLGNRLQMAMVREAAHIVESGIADVEDVDNVVRAGFGLRLPVYGLFEHQDMVGLDMGLGILDYVSTDLYNQPRAPGIVRDKVAAGELGVKSGRGYYDWSAKSAEAVRARRDGFVLDFLKRWR
jgi:3-hydroxybutyryl-CoA dehydrogenase